MCRTDRPPSPGALGGSCEGSVFGKLLGQVCLGHGQTQVPKLKDKILKVFFFKKVNIGIILWLRNASVG